MRGKTAGFLFIGICLILAALLMAKVITPLAGGCVFALALVALGGLSNAFRKP
jgi:hypothetical protein